MPVLSFMNRRRVAIILCGLCALAWGPARVAAFVGEPQLASSDARELWRKASDQVLAGDFQTAVRTFEQVNRLEPGHEQVTSAVGWMKKAEELAASRQRWREETYAYYVDKAIEAAQKARKGAPIERATAAADDESGMDESGEVVGDYEDGDAGDGEEQEEEKEQDSKSYHWGRALRYALNAMNNAADEESFRKEPWLQEIVDHTLEEIERYKAENEWSDATALYSYLTSLLPEHKEYEKALRSCAKRSHLEYVYGERTNWRAQLRDVTPSVIPQILERIDDDYVEEVDFKELCIAGLVHLRALANARSLATTFPSLDDQDRVRHFVARLDGLRDSRVGRRSGLTSKHLFQIFRRVLAANEDSLQLPEAVLVDEFVAGMMEPMDDFTSVIWPAEVDDFNKHTRGEFVGVGIQITQQIGKHIRVETPLEDSPAYRAGIKPGDMIVAVDGKDTKQMTINEAVEEITGEPGTKVTLTILDSVTEAQRDYVLVREQIKIRTVRGHRRDDSLPTGWNYMVDPDRHIGYVRVSGFMDDTVEDLEEALDQMKADGARGIILDLRFNPGGLLTAAIKMCELFIGEDDPIVKTKGRNRQQNMEITARDASSVGDMPLIILVNEYSASASEIVAGAVAGLKGACVVGTRTFGKGSVQNLIPIADNRAYLKLTTAHYYVYDRDLPGDRWYCLHHREDAKSWGVEPHVKVDVIPQEIAKILRLRRDRDVLKGRDQHAVPDEVLDRRPTSRPEDELPEDENPDVDPQLDTAVNLMRMKLLSGQPWAMPPRTFRALSQAEDLPKRTVER